jgi:hypothetical protein
MVSESSGRNASEGRGGLEMSREFVTKKLGDGNQSHEEFPQSALDTCFRRVSCLCDYHTADDPGMALQTII